MSASRGLYTKVQGGETGPSWRNGVVIAGLENWQWHSARNGLAIYSSSFTRRSMTGAAGAVDCWTIQAAATGPLNSASVRWVHPSPRGMGFGHNRQPETEGHA